MVPRGMRIALRIVKVRSALKCDVVMELTWPTWSAPTSTRACTGRFSTFPKIAVRL